MSRGGRGAYRGRTAAGRGGKQRIGGQEVAWDYDPELVVDSKPQDIYPVRLVKSSRQSQSIDSPNPIATVVSDY